MRCNQHPQHWQACVKGNVTFTTARCRLFATECTDPIAFVWAQCVFADSVGPLRAFKNPHEHADASSMSWQEMLPTDVTKLESLLTGDLGLAVCCVLGVSYSAVLMHGSSRRQQSILPLFRSVVQHLQHQLLSENMKVDRRLGSSTASQLSLTALQIRVMCNNNSQCFGMFLRGLPVFPRSFLQIGMMLPDEE